MSIELERVWVHPDLVVEFKHWKEKIEMKTGKKLNGGVPAVSKLAAEVLKRYRLKDRKAVNVKLEEKKGTNKNDMFTLP